MRALFSSFSKLFRGIGSFINLVVAFFSFLYSYVRFHLLQIVSIAESIKNTLVRFFMMKRGRYSRPFLHFATISVLGIGIMIAPFLTDTFPLFASTNSGLDKTPSPNSQQQSIAVDTNVFQTSVSSNVRSKIIDYTVEKGDTLSTIAQKFGISEDTIKWENNLTVDSTLGVGDSLKILPVTGIAYKVQSGDTVYTIAKKFATDAQKIVDFPFNDFANPETFSLVGGQILIVPDGVQPSAQSTYTAPVYAQVPQYNGPTSGGFIWPIRGIITQYFSWYHTGLDIAGEVGTPIYAAKSGVVMEASCGWNWGYGCHVLLDNGDSFSTMYAHMVQQPSVGIGQSVSQGQLIGFRGSTGRSTGPHTHFEIRIRGHVVNPLPYLP